MNNKQRAAVIVRGRELEFFRKSFYQAIVMVVPMTHIPGVYTTDSA